MPLACQKLIGGQSST